MKLLLPLCLVRDRHVDVALVVQRQPSGMWQGIGLMSLADRRRGQRLSRRDLPFVVGMIGLDIAAPVLLMIGVSCASASNVSLLGNFEIVATTVIALFLFREAVTGRLWGAIALITLSSILLSLEGADSFRFSLGSLFVLLATVCWGFENNCTRRISSSDTYEIVILKGLCCGLGSMVIALLRGERVPELRWLLSALVLGFAAYGLSIFLYVRAQSVLGAARTSAYYAVSPFIGALLSFAILRERLTGRYLLALAIMLAGTALVVVDTMARNHVHIHQHTFVHTHDGTTHSHTITHSHGHDHWVTEGEHRHHHSARELEEALGHHH